MAKAVCTSSGRFMNSLCASQYGFMVMAAFRHIGVAVTVFVHVAHERQVPSVMRGEGCLEFLHLSEGFVAEPRALGNLVGCGGLGVRVLAEHVQIQR